MDLAKSIKPIARETARRLRGLRSQLIRFVCRVGGVAVDGSAEISWTASIERGGGKVEIGSRSRIDRGVILRAYGGFITIGSDCSVNPYSVLYGDGGVTIGNGVRIAAHCVIVSANHVFTERSRYIFQQGQSCRGIVIEDDVWIGAGARVLDGVVLGKGCVIGAGAVVTRSTRAYGVYAGVPAREIGVRGASVDHQ